MKKNRLMMVVVLTVVYMVACEGPIDPGGLKFTSLNGPSPDYCGVTIAPCYLAYTVSFTDDSLLSGNPGYYWAAAISSDKTGTRDTIIGPTGWVAHRLRWGP